MWGEKNITKGWKRRKILSSVCRGQSRILAALNGFTGVISLFSFFFPPFARTVTYFCQRGEGKKGNTKLKSDARRNLFLFLPWIVFGFCFLGFFFPEERNSSKGRGTFNNSVAYSHPHLREQWWAFTAFPPPVSRPSSARCHQSTSVRGGGWQGRLRSRLFFLLFFCFLNQLRHPKSSLIASPWV